MKQETILIVDDEVMVREMIRDMLDAEGYNTTAVDSGKNALKVAQETDFDLLVTDIKMPEMDGLELVKELRRQNPNTVPILITGYGSITTAQKAIQRGVYDYILKPFDRNELTTAVENALSRKRLADENARFQWLFGLLQVTQAVAAGSEYQQLLEFIVRTAIMETKSAGGSIVLFDTGIGGLTIAAALGRWDYAPKIANVILQKSITSFGVEIGKGILLSKREQHPLLGLVNHYYLDDEQWNTGLKSEEVLLLALEIDREINGILSVCREAEQRPFSEGDLELLSILAAIASVAVKNHRSLSNIERAILSTLHSVASLVDNSSQHTRGHMERVAFLSRQLGIRIGLSAEEVELVSLAASLHDLGKAGIDEGQNMARRHPVIADEMLAQLQFLDEARALIRHHHERLDGGGYPDGLAGQEITATMHVLILANSYDNLVTGSSVEPALSPDDALLKLEEGKGSIFEPEITDSFMAMIRDMEHRE